MAEYPPNIRIDSHTRCIYTVLANPSYLSRWGVILHCLRNVPLPSSAIQFLHPTLHRLLVTLSVFAHCTLLFKVGQHHTHIQYICGMYKYGIFSRKLPHIRSSAVVHIRFWPTLLLFNTPVRQGIHSLTHIHAQKHVFHRNISLSQKHKSLTETQIFYRNPSFTET